MTILPKKKTGKEKSESETPDHPIGHPHHGHPHPHHHPPTSDTRHEKGGRGRNSPTRWLPNGGREELHGNLDPGGETPSHKRRHRSSPHRNHVRKHRGGHTAPATSHTVVSETSADYEETGYNSGDEYVPPKHPDNIEELEGWFESNLKEKKGFTIKKMGEDGACLFRAVADQVYGDQEMHGIVRRHCIDYMAKNSDYYSQYVTEDFNTYLNRKRMDNCHGNHLEMQAMCEMYNRPIEVYQYSVDPINTFHSAYKTDNEPIRISYHGNVHYNSIVDPVKATIGVGLGLPGFQPGLADMKQLSDAKVQSEEVHIEQTMLEDKLRETDWEVTQETIEEQVARESYLQWLRDNEKRARRRGSPRTASATCSSSSDYALMENVGSPDARSGRSPRNKGSNSNSAQNSPQRTEQGEQASPRPMDITGSPKQPQQPATTGGDMAGYACGGAVDLPQGATGGGATRFEETHSIMNQFSASMYAGLSDWEEEDILAQVIAQSQQEYLDSLKKNANHAKPSDGSSSVCSSSSENKGNS